MRLSRSRQNRQKVVECRELLACEAVFVIYFFAMTQLSHVDDEGRVRMVDTGHKETTSRRAVASAKVLMSQSTVSALREHRTPKGDPLEAARLAGIMAAKKTADLIPLCHPLPLTHIDVHASIEETGVFLEAEVSTNAQTGVEMEALTAVSVAALTIYDMCKALEKGITITDIRLESKTGGKSGDWTGAGSRSRKGRPEGVTPCSCRLAPARFWNLPRPLCVNPRGTRIRA